MPNELSSLYSRQRLGHRASNYLMYHQHTPWLILRQDLGRHGRHEPHAHAHARLVVRGTASLQLVPTHSFRIHETGRYPVTSVAWPRDRL